MEQIPPPPSVTATRTQSPYPPSYRNRSSATHFNITLDNTPLRFPHRISAGLTRVQDICYLAIPGFRPPLAIHKHLYINFDTEPHPLSHTTCELQQILQALFYSWKSLILRYTAPVNTTSASSFMLNIRHSMPVTSSEDNGICIICLAFTNDVKVPLFQHCVSQQMAR